LVTTLGIYFFNIRMQSIDQASTMTRQTTVKAASYPNVDNGNNLSGEHTPRHAEPENSALRVITTCTCGFSVERNIEQQSKIESTENFYQIIADLQRQLAEKDDLIAVLEHQGEMWYQDFTKERQDRENTKSRVVDLEKQLHASEEMLRKYSNDLDSQWRHCRTFNTGYPHSHITETLSRHEQQIKLSEDASLFPDYHCHVYDDSDDIIDSLLPPAADSDRVPDSSNSLVCPKCSAVFHVDNHLEFLDHIDMCVS